MKTLSLILAISVFIDIALFIIFFWETISLFWETISLISGSFFIGFLIYTIIKNLYNFILKKLNK